MCGSWADPRNPEGKKNGKKCKHNSWHDIGFEVLQPMVVCLRVSVFLYLLASPRKLRTWYVRVLCCGAACCLEFIVLPSLRPLGCFCLFRRFEWSVFPVCLPWMEGTLLFLPLFRFSFLLLPLPFLVFSPLNSTFVVRLRGVTNRLLLIHVRYGER